MNLFSAEALNDRPEEPKERSSQEPRKNFFDLTRGGLVAWVEQKNLKPFVARQIFKWVYQKRVYDPSLFSDVKKATQELLEQEFHFDLPQVLLRRVSQDGTVKYLYQLSDGKTIESVMIPGTERKTVCLSTQVGCKMACAFCVTGKMGFSRNLSAAEIVCQILAMQEAEQISNIVFMGEGEPLDNMEEVLRALDILQDELGLKFSHHRITLSTSGLVPKIIEFADRSVVNLAISLHAVDDELRDQIMPVNKAYSLKILLAALAKIPLKHRKRITFEYIVFGELNDSLEHAQKLVKILNPIKAKVNLIPYHANPYAPFKAPRSEQLLAFQDYLMKKNLQTNIRQSRGLDIEAACGLLISRYQEEEAFKPLLKKVPVNYE